MHILTMGEMSDEDFQNLYAWIDEIPLSRPKRNITRDFSDGGGKRDAINHRIYSIPYGVALIVDFRIIVVFELCSDGSRSSKAFYTQVG